VSTPITIQSRNVTECGLIAFALHELYVSGLLGEHPGTPSPCTSVDYLFLSVDAWTTTPMEQRLDSSYPMRSPRYAFESLQARVLNYRRRHRRSDAVPLPGEHPKTEALGTTLSPKSGHCLSKTQNAAVNTSTTRAYILVQHTHNCLWRHHFGQFAANVSLQQQLGAAPSH